MEMNITFSYTSKLELKCVGNGGQIKSGFFGSFFPLCERENSPEESSQSAGRNIIVIMPLVDILDIHRLCFVDGNVLMNPPARFWKELSLPLLGFDFFTDAHQI